jgi:hypothetical protein
VRGLKVVIARLLGNNGISFQMLGHMFLLDASSRKCPHGFMNPSATGAAKAVIWLCQTRGSSVSLPPGTKRRHYIGEYGPLRIMLCIYFQAKLHTKHVVQAGEKKFINNAVRGTGEEVMYGNCKWPRRMKSCGGCSEPEQPRSGPILPTIVEGFFRITFCL